MLRGAWWVVILSLTARPAAAQVSEPEAAPRGADGGVAAAPLPPTPVASAPTGTPAERLRWLQQQIDGAIADPLLSGARVGVAVAEIDTGRPLYARNELGLFNPASNVKLF